MRLTTTLAGGVLCVLASTNVFAQSGDSVFASKGFQQNRDYFSGDGAEHIDTLTGNVVLTYTDLVLPGNAERELRFQRTFNSKDARWTFGVVGLPALGESSNPDYPPIFTDASGAQHKSIIIGHDTNKTPVDWLVTTAEFWKYDRSLRMLYLPDSTIVFYDAQSRPTEARDTFGNAVTITYGSPQGCPTATCIRQTLSGSEVREVRLDAPLNDPNAFPAHMTYVPGGGIADRVWTYTPNDVTPPTGPGWHYVYEGAPGGVGYAVSATSPQGGTTRYEFKPHQWWYNTIPCPTCNGTVQTEVMSVIEYRRVYENGQEKGYWRYDFNFGNTEAANQSYETTMYASLDGSVTTYRYRGEVIGSTYMGCLGISNLFPGSSDVPLCSRTVVDVNNAQVEREEFQYAPVPLPAQVYPPFQYASPEMVQRTLTRDGRTYSTQSFFSGGFYGDFHRPYRTVETGELSRTTDRVFDYSSQYGFASTTTLPMILGPVQRETVTVGGQSAVRTWVRDANTGFLQTETAYGVTTSYEPDARGNVKATTLGDGTRTAFTYSWGIIQNTTTAAYTIERTINPDGTVASETRGGRTTQFDYDSLSRITRSTPPGSPSNEIVTDYIGGNQVRVTRGPTIVTTTLDGFGRVIEVAGPASTVRTRYDASGRKASETLPFSTGTPPTVSFAYDALGRLTSRTNADGTVAQQRYRPGLLEVEDENHHVTTQEWKAFGSPDDKRLTAVTDAAGQTWRYDYTVLGALSKVTAPGGVIREWQYTDPGHPGQLKTEIHPESATVTYNYDDAGRLKTKQDAAGTTFRYSYDGNGRLREVQAGQRITTITYEAGTDNRATASVDGVTTRYTYDSAGRLRSRTDDIAGSVQTLFQQFGYDGNDNLTYLQYASSREVGFAYNAANQVIGVIDLSEDTPRVFADNFQYHPSGAIASYRTANGVVHSTEYHPTRYWPSRIRAGSLLDLQYVDYDGVGNVGKILDGRPDMNQVFQYDNLDRLTGMTQTAVYPSVSYAYDAHGNRLSNSTGTYGYENQRLTNQNGDSFTYDANGNLKTSTYLGAAYDYTPDNQLAASTVDGITASYRYDADGWRIAKTSGLTSLYSRGPNGQLHTEVRPKLARDYIYAGAKLIGMIKNQEAGAAPEVKQVSASAYPGGVGFGFVADSPTGVVLQSASLERAVKSTSCSFANEGGCTFSSVDTAIAPAGLVAWSDSTSLSDTPPAGVYVYTVVVTDANGASDTGALVEVDTTDPSPNPFSFTSQAGVSINTVVSSNIVQITGIAGSIATSVSGGAYRTCADATCSSNPAFINTPSTITNGAYLQVRTTSSGTINTTVAVNMVVGTGSTTWSVTSSDQDADPDPFSFADQTGVTASTAVSSAIVPITGIAGNINISIAGGGGQYRVCVDASCATNPTFIAGTTTITSGSYVQLRITSSASAITPVSTTLTVGTGSTTWTVTTADDTTPTAFSFTDLTAVGLNTATLSNILQITGITTSVPVTIANGGGAFRVCPDATCSTNPAFGSSAGTIANGQYLQLRVTSSAAFLTAVSTTVTVGGVSDTWSVTTDAQDTTPNSFAFVNQTGIALNTVVSSNTVQVTGITGNVAVSISGGNAAKVRVCASSSCTGVAFQTAATTISNGQYLGLQQTSSSTNGATVTVTATVGTFSTPWSVTTLADPCAGSPAVGTTCADGSKFAGYSPANGHKMYTTPSDYPGDQQFAWPQDPYGYQDWNDGLVNTNGLAVVGNHPAAAACYYLTAHGKSDWYLPAPYEMDAMDSNRNAIGGFQADDTSYWTSREWWGDGWVGGTYHVMGSTFNGYTGMGISMPIRCIRRD